MTSSPELTRCDTELSLGRAAPVPRDGRAEAELQKQKQAAATPAAAAAASPPRSSRRVRNLAVRVFASTAGPSSCE